ncbi:unnamed protein product, partial [Brassica rapa]
RTIGRWHLSQCQSGALGYHSGIGAVVFIVLCGSCRVMALISWEESDSIRMESSPLFRFHFANIFNPIQAVTMDEV